MAILIVVFSIASVAKAFPNRFQMESSVFKDVVPALDDFVTRVQHEGSGPQGIWAEGLFAYRVDFTCWGCVPSEMDTAAFSTALNRFRGFFIHNYMGGDKLYTIAEGSPIAIVYTDRVDWFQVVSRNMYEAAASLGSCKYKGEGPFSVWGTDGQERVSVNELLNAHYTMSQLAIQTSICENGDVGFLVLNVGKIETHVAHHIEKVALTTAEKGMFLKVSNSLEKE
jgi:hypothetical protein